MATIDTTRIPRGGPVLALFMRGAFALLAQALVAVGFRLRHHPTAWRAVAAWWMVYGSLADVGCLVVLRWLLHRERLRLRDLSDMERCRPASDLRRSLGSIAVLTAAGAASNVLQRPFYGNARPPQITIVRVPRWALAYGVLIRPALWPATEELVYLGYMLPRLEAQLGSTGLAGLNLASMSPGAG